MSEPRGCAACGRDHPSPVAYCPYCGVAAFASAPAPEATVATARAPAPVEPLPAPLAGERPSFLPVTPPVPAPPPAEPSRRPRRPPKPPRPPKTRRRRRFPWFLIALLAVLAYCAAHKATAPRDGAPVAGAVSSRNLRLTRRWRTVTPPGLGISVRYALTTDTPLRVRIDGRVLAGRPGRVLSLPDDAADGFELRAVDDVSTARAADAHVTLSLLPAAR